MKNKNILISGAGIAGVTLAYWLQKYGFKPTIVEVAPQFREGGYMIDFFGAGLDVADKMGILPEIAKEDLKIIEMTHVDEHHKPKAGANINMIRTLLQNRFYNILRSSLAKIIYKKIQGKMECIFGNSIQSLEQNDQAVKVIFRDGSSRNFDLVIGADGLHSKVRNLVFGSESQFEKFYGFYTSSFTIDNYLEKSKSFYNYIIPHKQVCLYPVKDGKLAAFFLFRSSQKLTYDHHDGEAQKSILRNAFRDEGWEIPRLFEKMETAQDFFFDSVSQIQMNQWSKGRVSLVGDACDCPSLLSGQGSTLAMVGAYTLAGELKAADGDYQEAFQKYENFLKPLIDKKQKLASRLAKSLVPNSGVSLWIRNTLMKLIKYVPFVLKLGIKRLLTDTIVLKDY